MIASAEYKSTPTLGSPGRRRARTTGCRRATGTTPRTSTLTTTAAPTSGGVVGLRERAERRATPCRRSTRSSRFLTAGRAGEAVAGPGVQPVPRELRARARRLRVRHAVHVRHRTSTGTVSGLAGLLCADLAQIANYENTRSQFEAFLHHSTNKHNPSTGVVYWQLNKGWPTLLWSLYNADGDQPGASSAPRRPTSRCTRSTPTTTAPSPWTTSARPTQHGLSVQARVLDTAGKVLDDQTASGLSLAASRCARPGPDAEGARRDEGAARQGEGLLRGAAGEAGREGRRPQRLLALHARRTSSTGPSRYGNPQATLSQYGNLQAAAEPGAASQVGAVSVERASGRCATPSPR